MSKVVAPREQNRANWQTRFPAGQAQLLDALRRTDLRLEFVCKPENLCGLSIPQGVVVHGTIPHEQYGDTLLRTKVTAVLTHVLATVPRARSLAHRLTS